MREALSLGHKTKIWFFTRIALFDNFRASGKNQFSTMWPPRKREQSRTASAMLAPWLLMSTAQSSMVESSFIRELPAHPRESWGFSMSACRWHTLWWVVLYNFALPAFRLVIGATRKIIMRKVLTRKVLTRKVLTRKVLQLENPKTPLYIRPNLT